MFDKILLAIVVFPLSCMIFICSYDGNIISTDKTTNILFVTFTTIFVISLFLTYNKLTLFKAFQTNPFSYITRSIGTSFLLCGIFIEFIMTRCYPIFNDGNGKVVLEWYKSTGAWTFLSALMLVPPSIVIWYWRYIHKETDIKQKEAEIKQEQDNYVLEKIKHNDSLKTAEAKAFDDRYIKAIELFGKPETEIQLGVIFELENIALSSKTHFATIVNMLCAFVRHHRRKYVSDYITSMGMQKQFENATFQGIKTIVGANPHIDWAQFYNDIANMFGPQTSVYEIKSILNNHRFQRSILIQPAIITISKLNKYNNDNYMLPLTINLSESELSDIDFKNLFLKNVDFTKSIFDNTIFNGANLEGAIFNFAFIWGTSFDFAIMNDAKMKYITIPMLNPPDPKKLIRFNNVDLSKTDILCDENTLRYYQYNNQTKFPSS